MAIEDQFASDQVQDLTELVRQRLRILRFAGYLTAAYGLLLKALVPAVLTVLRGDGFEAYFQETTFTWIPVLLTAFLLGPWTRARFRPALRWRGALLLTLGGLTYYTFGLPTFFLNLPSEGDFTTFSQVYYSFWVLTFFVGAAAMLTHYRVRELFGREGDKLFNIPTLLLSVGVAAVAATSGVFVYLTFFTDAGADDGEVVIEASTPAVAVSVRSEDRVRELIPARLHVDVRDARGIAIPSQRVALFTQPADERSRVVAPARIPVRDDGYAEHTFHAGGRYRMWLEVDGSRVNGSLDVRPQSWLSFSSEFGAFSLGVALVAMLAFGSAAWIRRRALRAPSEPRAQPTP